MLINLWLSGLKLWLLERKIFRVVGKLLYVSLGIIQRKSFFQNSSTISAFPPQPQKSFNFRRKILDEVVKNAFYAFRRTLSGKPKLFREKIYIFIIFGIWNKSKSIISQKIPKKFLYTEIYLSSGNSYPKFFSLKEKLFPSFLFGFWQTKFQIAE